MSCVSSRRPRGTAENRALFHGTHVAQAGAMRLSARKASGLVLLFFACDLPITGNWAGAGGGTYGDYTPPTREKVAAFTKATLAPFESAAAFDAYAKMLGGTK